MHHAMTKVHNFNGDQNNQHDNKANASQKQKSRKANANLQHICFCPNASCPLINLIQTK
jgi:hypothetical protein